MRSKFKAGSLRKDYKSIGLDELTIEMDPIKLFEEWFNKAVKQKVLEPNAMTLATADKNGRPSARIVLLKDFNDKGFTFFTNYESRKGKEISENKFAALLFWWGSLVRQIRIEGKVQKISIYDSDQYFNSRPRGSQLGALISKQSRIIPAYSYLEKEFKKAADDLKGKDIKRPDNWGGYRIKPLTIEFWQGRENRLHDRLRFTKIKSKEWKLERLSP